jgi:hypothetical protein
LKTGAVNFGQSLARIGRRFQARATFGRQIGWRDD